MTAPNTDSEISPTTPSEQAQQEIMQLRKLVDRYEQILLNVNEGFIYVSRTGTVLNANQELHKIANTPADSLIGKNVFTLIKQLLQPKQVKTITKMVKDALSGKQINAFELSFQDRILEISARYEANIDGITGIIRDITQRKQREAELQKTEALYRSLFENAPIMYVTTINVGGWPIISECNNVFISQLGYSREQVIGQQIDIFYTAASTEQLYTGGGYQRALNGDFDLEERDFITNQGKIIHSLIRSIPDLDEDGNTCGTRTLYLDISKRKKAEQKLEQAIKIESVLFKIVQASEIAPNLESLFQVVHKELSVIFDTSNFFITLYDQGKDLLSFPVWADEKDQHPDSTPPGKGAVAYVIKKGCTQLLTKKTLKSLADKGEMKIIGSSPTLWLGVPLQIDNDIIGVMAIYRYDSKISISNHDREVLEFVAGQISKTIAKKQADVALSESEGRFRSLYENSTIGLYRTTPAGEILLANPTLVNMMGYDTLAELQKSNLEDGSFFRYKTRADFKKSLEKSGEIRGYESTWIKRNGLSFQVRESTRAIRDKNGIIKYFEGTVEDITANKHREQLFEVLNKIALAVELTFDLDEIFNTVNIEFKKLGFHYILLENAPDSSYLQIKYHRYNSKVVKIGERLLGLKTLGYKVPVQQSDILKQIIQKKQTIFITDTQGGLAQTLPERRSHQAGKLIKILKASLAIAAPLIVEEQVRGILLVMSSKLTEKDIPAVSIFARQIAASWYRAQLFDKARREISERAHAEEALQISEEKYRTIIENTREGIFIFQNNKIEFCNHQFTVMFDLKNPGDLDSDQIELMLSDDYIDKINDLQKSKNSADTEIVQIICKMETIEGESFDAEAQGSYIIYNDQPAIQGVVRDISEKISLEEQLRQSQKMESIGHLAGGIAHDFNNMLGGIIGFAELALKHISDTEYVGTHLGNIIRKCDDTSQLVLQLLAFSRKQILDIQPLHLNSVIIGSLKFMQRVIGENIVITQDFDNNISIIHADLTALDQSITNICLNSRDAMPDGGNLLIQTRNVTIDNHYCRNHAEASPGDFVLMKITDDGIGMDSETAKIIFEPFFTTKETGKGTGLGLSMVYGLVKQHNGFIECESKPGKGTSISIYFPVQTDEVTQAMPDSEAVIPGGSETLLLVEDDSDLLAIMQDILGDYGYQVLTAKNGMEAIKQYDLNKAVIKLIISDIVMPGMGGAQLYNNIHTQDPNIRFLFITGYALDKTFNSNIKEEHLDLIYKPFRKEAIAKKVREILER